MDKQLPSLEQLIKIAQQAGQYALGKWRDGDIPDAKVWDKSENNPVCDVDLAIDRYLKIQLQQLCPDAGWLSEETADDAERLGYRFNWSVDPIDGTRDYIVGKAGWCISIALLDGDKPILAALAAPAMEALWSASLGNGAYRNGRKLWASKRQIIKGARIPADKLWGDQDKFTLVNKPNSIALRMAMIASDDADVVASVRLGNEWDIVAAHLIAAEAGAYVGDVYGNAIKYNKPKPIDYGMICCAPALKDDIVSQVKPAVDRIFNRC